MSDELPEGWRSVTLAEAADPSAPIMYGILQPGPDLPDGVPYVRPTEIDDGEIQVAQLRRTSQEIAARYKRAALRADDVLLSIVGTIGKVALVPRTLEGANITQSSVRIRSGENAIPAFIAAQLRSPQVRVQFEAATLGTGVPRLNVGDVRELRVRLPSLAEQRRIVAKLEALQARSRRAKEALDTVPALLEKLRQSILAAAFRGDLTKDWRAQNPNVEPASELLKRIRAERRAKWEEAELAKLKAKGKTPSDDKWKAKYKEPEAVDTAGLPVLPAGWCWAALEDVLISLDQGWSPQCEASPRTSSDEWAVMRTTAVQQLRFDENENKRLPAGLEPRPGAELAVGDLLITRAGPRVRAGVCCRVDAVGPRLMACDKVYRFRMDERFALGAFVELVLNSPTALEAIERMKTGISESGVNLTREKFLALSVPVPPLREQSRIVDAAQQAVRDCHRFALAEHDLVDSLATLDSALLDKAFRGELVAQKPDDP